MWARGTCRRLFQPHFLKDQSHMPTPARTVLALFALLAPFAGALPMPAGAARAPEVLTPLLFAVENAPVPFLGSDGQTHLVYELFVTNFSSGEALLERVEVLGDGKVIATLDATALSRRLQPAGEREASGTLPPSTQALLFLHVTLRADAPVPKKLSHRVAARITAAPPGKQQMTETGGETAVARGDIVVIAPPLSGARFISAIPAAMRPATPARRCRSTAAFLSRSASPSTGNSLTAMAGSIRARRPSLRATRSTGVTCSRSPTRRWCP